MEVNPSPRYNNSQPYFSNMLGCIALEMDGCEIFYIVLLIFEATFSIFGNSRFGARSKITNIGLITLLIKL